MTAMEMKKKQRTSEQNAKKEKGLRGFFWIFFGFELLKYFWISRQSFINPLKEISNKQKTQSIISKCISAE